MSDGLANSFSGVLSVLRTLPLWLIAGLAISSYALLFIPAFGASDIDAFRKTWGVWFWIGAILFSILTLTRGVDAAVASYRANKAKSRNQLALRIVPRLQNAWWHLAKQRDDSFHSQISLDIEIANLTDHPVRIVKVRLIRPRANPLLINSHVMIPAIGSPYHSDKHAIPARDTATASIHLMVRKALAAQSKPLRVSVGVTDQFGHEYFLKRILVPSHDRPWPKRSLKEKLLNLISRFHNKNAEINRPLPAIWNHQGKFQFVDMILMEEKRNYAACGRDRGGLGSVNMSLQNEPNRGWTTSGTVPELLWEKSKATRLNSPNLNRLLTRHAALNEEEKTSLVQYLISLLDRRSAYSDIAYFIFLALHRMGRTNDALKAARQNLSGDKVYGYSNLLGTLSGLISHEYFDMNDELLAELLTTVEGDTEHNFRVREKINLARLRNADAA